MARSVVTPSLPPRIESQEYRSRQDRAREEAANRSLSGLLAWGRGGQDPVHYADLYYLTDYYSNMVVSPTPEPAALAGRVLVGMVRAPFSGVPRRFASGGRGKSVR